MTRILTATHFRLVRWLYTRAWVSAERPIALFDLTTARLVKIQPAEGGNRYSLLDRLRRAPTRINAAGMLDALDRLSEFRALRVVTYVGIHKQLILNSL